MLRGDPDVNLLIKATSMQTEGKIATGRLHKTSLT